MKSETFTEINPASLEHAYKAAHHITKAYARTFYFASVFLPPYRRKHAYAIYAFCRTVDSLVDDAEEGQSFEEVRQRLEELRQFVRDPTALLPPYSWASAFRETVLRLGIPAFLFEELLKGVEMDLYKSRYATFQELYLYAYRVAGVVGQMMCYVYGLTDSQSLQYAEKLGVAMQLTNILRDVGEDWVRGRLYLPQEDLARFGVAESEIASGRPSPAYEELIHYQIARARAYYREAAPGIARIPSFGIRLTTLLMARLYEGILDKLQEAPSQNLVRRTALTYGEKSLLTLKTLLGLAPLGTKPLPELYWYAVALLLFITPFALLESCLGLFKILRSVSDSLYLFLWGGIGAYAMSVYSKRGLFAWGVGVILGWVIEVVGTQTGYPFGPYRYTDVLQPQLAGVPWVIAGAWGSLIGLWTLLGPPERYKRAIWTAIGALATDLLLEPYATTIRHYWHWQPPHIPLSNYLSWEIFAAFLSLFYPRYDAQALPYPDLVRSLGRVLLFLLVILLLISNLVHGAAGLASLGAAGIIFLMLLWRRI